MASQEPETHIVPGQVLAGKYQVTRLLGRGGMGVVVEAHRLGLGERVAIKVLHPHYCNHPEAVTRFGNEARAATRIRGEHSARVLDVGTSEQGLPFIVMELLEGADLSTVIRHGGVTLAMAVLYILQACEGMAEVHANGIIHRDLKPGNLFVTRRPDGSPLVKVLDFGVAKSAFPTEDTAQQQLTMTLVALGTPLYMSPEQVRSSRHVDARSDVWSLGAILYELLCGRPAFGGNTVANITAQVLEADPMPLTELRPDIPPDLDRVVRKALAKRPEHRWLDVASFALALAPWGGDLGRAHAERAARILGGEGRGAGPFTAPDMTVDMEPTPGLRAGEDTVRRFEAGRQRSRERILLGALVILAVAAAFIGWSVISAYREQEALGSPVLTAEKGVSAATVVRATVAKTVASLAASASSAAASASASASAAPPSKGPKTRPRSRGGHATTNAATPAPDYDPLSTRR